MMAKTAWINYEHEGKEHEREWTLDAYSDEEVNTIKRFLADINHNIGSFDAVEVKAIEIFNK